MAKVVFKSYNPNDGELFPPYLGDFVPENHPARIVSAVVEKFDISDILSGYKGGGASSYHPRALLKVLLYAYLTNVYSGRQVERLWKESIVYMWLGGKKVADFRTINSFRSGRLQGRFEELFSQMVELLHAEGLVSLDVQYIDGTKIEAAANKYTFVWRKATETNKAKLDHKVKAVLEQARAVAEMEAEAAPERQLTSEEIAEKTGRILERMEEMQAEGKQVDKAVRKAVKQAHDDMAPKMKEYEEKLAIVGDRGSYSKTDHDASFMRMKEDAMNNGQTKPGYNLQIATENQFVTNFGLFQTPSDWYTLIPFLDDFREKYGRDSYEIVADSGYGNEGNYEYMLSHDMLPYVKYTMFHAEQKKKRKKNPFLQENMYYNRHDDYYVCPMGQHMTHIRDHRDKSAAGYVHLISIYEAQNCIGCPLRCLCYKGKADRRTIEVNHRNNELKAYARELLTSERGLYHRSNRPIEPEAVFGDIKFNHGFKRFRLRGLPKVIVESGLVLMAHNLRKYILHGKAKAEALSKSQKSMQIPSVKAA